MIGTIDPRHREVAVVGGGIAGLLAAYELDKSGYEVTLYEASSRCGGLISTKQTPFGISESAAHSLLVSKPVEKIFNDLKIPLTSVRDHSKARFIVRGEKIRKLPFGALKPSELLTTFWRFLFARSPGKFDSLDDWGRRHLGDSAVDYLLSPFVTGVFGVNPKELHPDVAFPALSTARGESLFQRLREGKKQNSGPRAKMSAPTLGMGSLVSALEQHLERRLGARLKRSSNLDRIPDSPNVVLATPAHTSARLLASAFPLTSSALASVRYTPIVSATAFAAVPDFETIPRGVGVLMPPRENRKILGILFNSSAFEGRSLYDRFCSLTVMLGGSSHPEWIEAEDHAIQAAIEAELEALYGFRGKIMHLEISRWAKAIPQYSSELAAVWKTAQKDFASKPGRMLFGNYTGQVSIRGMIESAAKIIPILLCGFFLMAQSFAAESVDPKSVKRIHHDAPKKIEDNSFLLEEAYNQETGEVQHVQTLQYMHRTRSWYYTLSQEFPIPYKPHQFSYTFNFLKLQKDAGLGDLFLHYRYQLIENDGLLFAPRFSAIVPAGRSSLGLGGGAWGVQTNMPVTLEVPAFGAFHFNLGETFQKEKFYTNYGVSAIWMPSLVFNLFIEGVGLLREDGHFFTANPGFRVAYNFEAGPQLVTGLSAPLTFGGGAFDYGGLFYLSYEHYVW